MGHIGHRVSLPRNELRDQATNAAQQAVNGTGVHAPVIPNQSKDDAGRDGQGNGQNTEHQAQSHGVRGGGYAKATPSTTAPWMAGDSVLYNTRGFNTFATGSMMRPGFAPGGKFTTTQGKALRIAGDIPAQWNGQMNNERTAVSMQTKTMNRDFVANGRYNVPIRV